MNDSFNEEKTFNISLGTIANRWERLGASLIDGIILFLIPFLLTTVASLSGVSNPSSGYIALSFTYIFQYFFYFPISTILWGGSPGKLLMKLKVVSSTYEPLSPGSVYLRESLGKIAGIFCFGMVWIFFNPRNKTAWDFIANSIVVKKTV